MYKRNRGRYIFRTNKTNIIEIDKWLGGFIYDALASGNIKQIDNIFFNTSGPTRLSYNIYAQATDIVKQSIVTGLANLARIEKRRKLYARRYTSFMP